ncbi:MAG: TSUP family transporter [Clostridia bacterium]|nr:TSUP family transporter [Clostridia bacterium]
MTFLKKYWLHILIGLLAGATNGILGAGGGIIVTYFLSHALTFDQKQENGVFANAVATMLPLSVISLSIYLYKGYINLDTSFFTLIPSALIGGIVGAYLLTKLHLKVVKTIFSILVIICGAMMIFK